MEEHEAAEKLTLANKKRERLGTWSELSSSVRGKKGEGGRLGLATLLH